MLEMDHWFHDFFQRSSNEVETWKWDSMNSNFAIKVHTRISSIFWSPTDQWSWIMSKRCVSILLYLNFTIALKGKMLAYAWPSFSNSYIFFKKRGWLFVFQAWILKLFHEKLVSQVQIEICFTFVLVQLKKCIQMGDQAKGYKYYYNY